MHPSLPLSPTAQAGSSTKLGPVDGEAEEQPGAAALTAEDVAAGLWKTLDVQADWWG